MMDGTGLRTFSPAAPGSTSHVGRAGSDPEPKPESGIKAGPQSEPDTEPEPEPEPDADAATSPGTAIKRRAPIACKRCRRMRSKCIHDKAKPPCAACTEAGLAAEDCIFPVRGQPDHDRQYRHPRTRSERTRQRHPRRIRRSIPSLEVDVEMALNSPGSPDLWADLPPLAHLIDGVNRFTHYYFQLGFIPKQQFPERLRRDHMQVNMFLLLSILSISARLTPALGSMFGNGIRAAEYFMERASFQGLSQIYQEPSLERCQAFYLLSIAQQGSGLRNKSFINMGISIRMAVLMQLHREETYHLQDPTPDLITRAESARRTLWMLHSQDSLHSGPSCPVSIAAADITTLLPCDEEDFARGRQPSSRAALEGTPPAIENPSLIRDPNRSLFASLMQIHHFWGIVRRRAVKFARSSRPWDPSSEFARMVHRLEMWEKGLPRHHLWSNGLLKQYKAQGEDLAYLSVTMVTRLCNIIVRRPYLIDIINLHSKDPHGANFFSTLSTELFRNVNLLFEQIDAQFTGRSPDESVGAQMAAFCVYSCGLFSAYLCKYPHLCQDQGIAHRGPLMLNRTTSILMECKEVWPLASRWAEALDKFTQDPQAATLSNQGTMADSKEPLPDVLSPIQKPESPGGSQHLWLQPAAPRSARLPVPGPAESLQNNPSRTPDRQLMSSDVLPPLNPLPPRQSPYGSNDSFQSVHPPAYQEPGAMSQAVSEQQSEGLNVYVPAVSSFTRQQTWSMSMAGEPFEEFQPAPGPMTYDINSTVPFYQQLVPGNDGFDSELQLYIDGLTGWAPPLSNC